MRDPPLSGLRSVGTITDSAMIIGNGSTRAGIHRPFAALARP